MEKFKACEKEMKTKAFSKEGLIQSTKLDPKAKEKMETNEWLQKVVDSLQLQVEQTEAEVETLQGGGKKKSRANGAQAERLEGLERLNERRKWHISRLELIMRLLENGSIAPERINDLKEDILFFVDAHTVCSTMTAIPLWHDSRLQKLRMMISMRTRASTMTSTSMKRRRSLALLTMMSIVMIQRMTVKVRAFRQIA